MCNRPDNYIDNYHKYCCSCDHKWNLLYIWLMEQIDCIIFYKNVYQILYDKRILDFPWLILGKIANLARQYEFTYATVIFCSFEPFLALTLKGTNTISAFLECVVTWIFSIIAFIDVYITNCSCPTRFTYTSADMVTPFWALATFALCLTFFSV